MITDTGKQEIFPFPSHMFGIGKIQFLKGRVESAVDKTLSSLQPQVSSHDILFLECVDTCYHLKMQSLGLISESTPSDCCPCSKARLRTIGGF